MILSVLAGVVASVSMIPMSAARLPNGELPRCRGDAPPPPNWGSGPQPPVWGGASPSAVWLAPDGRRAVVANQTSVIVDAPSGAPVAKLPAGWDGRSVAFAPDSSRVALVDVKRACVAVWKLSPAREEVCVLAADDQTRVAFSPDGTAIAAIRGGALIQWSISSRSAVWSVPTQAQGFVAWPDSAVILTGGEALVGHDAADGRVRWTAARSRDRRATTRYDSSLGASQGNAVVVIRRSEGDSSQLGRFDLSTGTLRDLTGKIKAPRAGALFDDGTAWIVGEDKVAHRYRLGGRELARSPLPPEFTSIAVRRDGRLAIAATSGGVRLFDVGRGALVDAVHTATSTPAPRASSVVPPDVLDNLRIVGDGDIRPDDVTITEILRSGKDRVMGSYNVCVDEDGTVSSVDIKTSSRFSAYDMKIMRTIKRWEFLPHLVAGKAVPVCTLYTVVADESKLCFGH